MAKKSNITIDVGLLGHPKTLLLNRLLGAGSMDHLLWLWCFASSERKTGDLDRMSVADIEKVSKWKGEKGEFVSTLLTIGFIDFHDGVFSIHDWKDHQPRIFNFVELSRINKLNIEKRWKGKTRVNPPVKKIDRSVRDDDALIKLNADTDKDFLLDQLRRKSVKLADYVGQYGPENLIQEVRDFVAKFELKINPNYRATPRPQQIEDIGRLVVLEGYSMEKIKKATRAGFKNDFWAKVFATNGVTILGKPSNIEKLLSLSASNGTRQQNEGLSFNEIDPKPRLPNSRANDPGQEAVARP